MFGTLQDRLPKELKLAGITDIEALVILVAGGDKQTQNHGIAMAIKLSRAVCGDPMHRAPLNRQQISRRGASGARLPCSQFFSVGSEIRYNAAKRCCDICRAFRIAFTSGIFTVVTRTPDTLRPTACAAACCMLSINSFPNLLMISYFLCSLPLFWRPFPFNTAASLRMVRFSSADKSSRVALA
jgi:hypothetical protein